MISKYDRMYLSRDQIKELERMEVEERCKMLGQYLIDYPKMSIRQIAREQMMSKSQVHRDLHELRFIDDDMYCQCMNILRRRRR